MSGEEYTGEERRQQCSKENRCTSFNELDKEVAKEIERTKISRGYVGVGVVLIVLFSGANTWFQYSGTQAQAETALQVTQMSKKLDALQSTVDFLGERMYFVQRKQELQDFDTRMTRFYLNKMFKKLGVDDPIDTTPFEPPDFPEMSQKLKELREKARIESEKH